MGNEYVPNAECPNYTLLAGRAEDPDFLVTAAALCRLTQQLCPVTQGRECVNTEALKEMGLRIVPLQARNLVKEKDNFGRKNKRKKGKNEAGGQHYTNEPVVVLLNMLSKYWLSPAVPYVVEDGAVRPG